MLVYSTFRQHRAHIRWVSLAAGLVAVGLLVGGQVAVVPRAEAVAATVRDVTASAVVSAARPATWYQLMTPAGLCRVVPGCTRGRRDGPVTVLTLNVVVPGLGQVGQEVRLRVTRSIPQHLADLSLSATSDQGTLTGTMRLVLARAGRARTGLTMRIPQASGTGALGTTLLPLLNDGLQPGLTAQVDDLNRERAWSQIRVRASGRVSSRGRVTAAVRLTTGALTLPPPTASGRMRVLRGTDVVCRVRVTASRARCTYPTGRGRPPKQVRVVVTGRYSNGFPVWHAGHGRVADR